MNRIRIRKYLLLLSLLIMQSGAGHVSAAPGADEMRDRLQACAGCHDPANQVQPQPQSDIYYPSIDGKPVEYLFQQLLNFRDGRRDNPIMRQMLAYLSSEYLHEIAAYYAQKPLIHEPDTSTSSDRVTLQSAAVRTLVEQADGERPACTGCHGEDLNGDGVAIPGLRGLGEAYITAQLGAWRAGTRQAREPDCMAEVANALDGAEIAAIARWIASAPLDPDSKPLPDDYELSIPCGAVQ